jgi:hypothetical protein
VIRAKTRVVFKSLLIGLKYKNILGEIEDHNQSITNQKRFQKNIINDNQAIIGKYALENFLSFNPSKKVLSKNDTKLKTAALNLEFGFFNALLANIEKIKTIIKKTNVAIFVLLIGQ